MNIAAAVSLLATATGLVFGIVWWRIAKAPGWHPMRWFSAVALTAAGYCAFDALIVFDLDPKVIQWATQMALTFGALHAYAWVRWFAESVGRPLDRFDKAMLGSALLWAAAGLVPGLLVSDRYASFTVEAIGVTYRAFIPTTLGLVGYLFFLLTMWVVAWRSFARWQAGWRARLPALAVMVLTVLAVNDTLATAQIIKMPMLTDFGFLVVVLAFGIESLGRFAADAERLDHLTHRLEQAVEERTTQLEAAHLELAKERTVAAVGRLAGGVAHQINNPATVLTINLGFMRDELVEQGQLSSTMGELLDESRESLHRIVGIVSDLRVSARTIETHGSARFAAGLRACADVAVAQATRRGARATRTDCDIAPALLVLGDREVVGQLLTEIVANAARAAYAARAESSRVGISARAENGYVDVDISDNGAGVPEHVRAALFEPFASDAGDVHGRGLGLSVARGLAAQMGAALRLTESSDAGTVFTVRFRAVPSP